VAQIVNISAKVEQMVMSVSDLQQQQQRTAQVASQLADRARETDQQLGEVVRSVQKVTDEARARGVADQDHYTSLSQQLAKLSKVADSSCEAAAAASERAGRVEEGLGACQLAVSSLSSNVKRVEVRVDSAEAQLLSPADEQSGEEGHQTAATATGQTAAADSLLVKFEELGADISHKLQAVQKLQSDLQQEQLAASTKISSVVEQQARSEETGVKIQNLESELSQQKERLEGVFTVLHERLAEQAATMQAHARRKSVVEAKEANMLGQKLLWQSGLHTADYSTDITTGVSEDSAARVFFSRAVPLLLNAARAGSRQVVAVLCCYPGEGSKACQGLPGFVLADGQDLVTPRSKFSLHNLRVNLGPNRERDKELAQLLRVLERHILAYLDTNRLVGSVSLPSDVLMALFSQEGVHSINNILLQNAIQLEVAVEVNEDSKAPVAVGQFVLEGSPLFKSQWATHKKIMAKSPDRASFLVLRMKWG